MSYYFDGSFNFPDEPFCLPQSPPDDDILVEGSDVEEEEPTMTKRWQNRESIARAYVKLGIAPFIQSALLKGPLDNWKNPWQRPSCQAASNSNGQVGLQDGKRDPNARQRKSSIRVTSTFDSFDLKRKVEKADPGSAGAGHDMSDADDFSEASLFSHNRARDAVLQKDPFKNPAVPCKEKSFKRNIDESWLKCADLRKRPRQDLAALSTPTPGIPARRTIRQEERRDLGSRVTTTKSMVSAAPEEIVGRIFDEGEKYLHGNPIDTRPVSRQAEHPLQVSVETHEPVTSSAFPLSLGNISSSVAGKAQIRTQGLQSSPQGSASNGSSLYPLHQIREPRTRSTSLGRKPQQSITDSPGGAIQYDSPDDDNVRGVSQKAQLSQNALNLSPVVFESRVPLSNLKIQNVEQHASRVEIMVNADDGELNVDEDSFVYYKQKTGRRKSRSRTRDLSNSPKTMKMLSPSRGSAAHQGTAIGTATINPVSLSKSVGSSHTKAYGVQNVKSNHAPEDEPEPHLPQSAFTGSITAASHIEPIATNIPILSEMSIPDDRTNTSPLTTSKPLTNPTTEIYAEMKEEECVGTVSIKAEHLNTVVRFNLAGEAMALVGGEVSTLQCHPDRHDESEPAPQSPWMVSDLPSPPVEPEDDFNLYNNEGNHPRTEDEYILPPIFDMTGLSSSSDFGEVSEYSFEPAFTNTPAIPAIHSEKRSDRKKTLSSSQNVRGDPTRYSQTITPSPEKPSAAMIDDLSFGTKLFGSALSENPWSSSLKRPGRTTPRKSVSWSHLPSLDDDRSIDAKLSVLRSPPPPVSLLQNSPESKITISARNTSTPSPALDKLKRGILATPSQKTPGLTAMAEAFLAADENNKAFSSSSTTHGWDCQNDGHVVAYGESINNHERVTFIPTRSQSPFNTAVGAMVITVPKPASMDMDMDLELGEAIEEMGSFLEGWDVDDELEKANKQSSNVNKQALRDRRLVFMT